MTIDLTGGVDRYMDEITADTPDSPTYREGVSMWIWNHGGRWGLPRIGVEAPAATWETSRGIMLNLALRGGRLLTVRSDEPPLPAGDRQGRPRVLGAGPLRFECVEPFARWRLSFEGHATPGNVQDQLDEITHPAPREARDPGKPVPIRLDIDARMAAPPWVQGSMDPDGHFVNKEHRFEQLFTATGTVSIDGEQETFSGGGLRIHRKGGTRGEFKDWYGHCWQSALFPSGRGFGFIHYHPRPDGSVKYHEGWVKEAGEVLPARVVNTPWMKNINPWGEDVSFTLRTSGGKAREVRIEAETFVSAFTPPRPIEDRIRPTLQSGITRCRWGDEESYGMIERSAFIPSG